MVLAAPVGQHGVEAVAAWAEGSFLPARCINTLE